MSDEFDLLAGQEPDEGPRRRTWAVLTGVLVVALFGLVGVIWMVNALVSGGATVDTAAPAATTAAPTTTPAPPTESVDMTIPTVPSPTPSVPTPRVTLPRVPVTTAATVVAPPPTPAPTTPKPVPKPVPTRPTPKPTPGRLVEVPPVVGQKVKTAVITLEAAGFKVTILGGAFAPGPRDDRRVTAQTPAGGSKAPPGTRVVLVTDGL